MDKDSFKTANIFFQEMLQRKKGSHLEQKLVQNSKKPKELQKTLKSLVFRSKEGNTSTISLNKDGTIQFEPLENKNIFKNFYSELAIDLVKKLPVARNKFCGVITKDYYADMFNNKKPNSVTHCLRRFRLKKMSR